LASGTKEEQKLEFFENRMLMKISEPKRHEARGG
jgi:hypothetical protein